MVNDFAGVLVGDWPVTLVSLAGPTLIRPLSTSKRFEQLGVEGDTESSLRSQVCKRFFMRKLSGTPTINPPM